MHPVLFSFETPNFLHFLFGETITIYSYGAIIAFGSIMAYLFTAWRAKKEHGITSEKVVDLIIVVIIAAVIGGRFFVFFERPEYYFGNPSNMFKLSSKGFVFYGSLLFVIPAMLWFFKWKKMPVFPMLDIMAFTALLVHGIGRIGCFMAGCCYGHVHDGFFSVVFTDPMCAAKPLNEPLYPTQLISSFSLFTMFGILWWFRSKQTFYGQLFLLYIMMYAVFRSIIEIFRGDLARGFVIEDVLSNSQFISILVIIGALYFYRKMSKNPKLRLARGKK